MRSLSAQIKSDLAQKGIVHIIPLLVVAVIVAAAIWFFLTNRGGLERDGMSVPIDPSQLMPFVSAQEARKTICNLKKEELFVQVCQSKFDAVGKEDIEKISELFDLLNTIQNNKSIPDYERLLLAQAVFAALPNKDSPQVNLYQPSLLSRLRDYLTSHRPAYAQEKGMSEEEFKKMMERDLQNVAGSLPKGDNAWVINIMVSKYSWIDGKRQPLYADQYLESFDPFPNNPNVNTRDINYHVRSIIGSQASGQTVDIGRSSYKGTSEMFAYSFTIMSWNSREYTGADGPVEEKFLVDRWDFSDANYWGEHYLTGLLDAVKMPPTKRLTESSDEKKSKVDIQTNTQDKSPVLAKQPWEIKINCPTISTTLPFKNTGEKSSSNYLACISREDEVSVSNTLVRLGGNIEINPPEDLSDPNQSRTSNVAPDKSEDLTIGDDGQIFYWGPPWGETLAQPAVEYRAKLGLCDMVLWGSALENYQTGSIFGFKADWPAAGEFIVKKLSSAAKEIAANIAEECGSKR